jgi:hypothetical protein
VADRLIEDNEGMAFKLAHFEAMKQVLAAREPDFAS